MYLKIKIEYFKCASLKLIMLQYKKTSVFYRKLRWDHFAQLAFVLCYPHIYESVYTHTYIYMSVCFMSLHPFIY